MSPQPPLTADELLDLFNRYAPSEIVAQIKVEGADAAETYAIGKHNVQRWKDAYKSRGAMQ